MTKLLSMISLGCAAFLAWDHGHPMVVAAAVLGVFGLLSAEASKHPRLQGALNVAAALGIDVNKIRDGVVQMLTGDAPSAEETDLVDSAVDKVVK